MSLLVRQSHATQSEAVTASSTAGQRSKLALHGLCKLSLAADDLLWLCCHHFFFFFFRKKKELTPIYHLLYSEGLLNQVGELRKCGGEGHESRE